MAGEFAAGVHSNSLHGAVSESSMVTQHSSSSLVSSAVHVVTSGSLQWHRPNRLHMRRADVGGRHRQQSRHRARRSSTTCSTDAGYGHQQTGGRQAVLHLPSASLLRR